MAAYDLWNAELVNPTPPERRLDRTQNGAEMSGFWRVIGGKTRFDEPVAIFTKPGDTAATFQFGDRHENDTFNGAKSWKAFLDWRWPKSVAVSKEDYDRAISTGWWPDGRPAKSMSETERLGIEIDAGDNEAPLHELLADQIEVLADRLDRTQTPTTQEEANLLSGLLDKMRVMVKLAENARVDEKEPYLEAGRAVDGKWNNVKDIGIDAGKLAAARRTTFLVQEQRRLDEIAAEENRKRQEAARAAAEVERKRLQDIADKEAEVERQRRQKIADEEAEQRRLAAIAEAEKAGFTAEEVAQVAEAEKAPVIEVQAEVVEAPQQVQATQVEAQKARAGSTLGRSVSLRTVKVAFVEDAMTLAVHLVETKDADMSAYLLTRAQKALRGKIVLPGCGSRDELQ